VLNTEGFDAKKKGLRPAERAAHYSVDESLAHPAPDVIVLFDDILTTGCHFKAMELVLKERFPDVEILGLFLARAVRPPEENDVLGTRYSSF
jgi:predicted amidophosphoribosyltransferase